MGRRLSEEDVMSIINTLQQDIEREVSLSSRAKAFRVGVLESAISRIEHHLLSDSSGSYDTDHHEYRFIDDIYSHVADVEYVNGTKSQPSRQFVLSLERARNNGVKFIFIQRIKVGGPRIVTIVDDKLSGRSLVMGWDEFYVFMENLPKSMDQFEYNTRFFANPETKNMDFYYVGDDINKEVDEVIRKHGIEVGG